MKDTQSSHCGKRKEDDKLSVIMVCLNAQKETHDVFLQMMKTLLGVEMPENEFLKLMHT